jgi:hypothetical protein
MPPMKKVFVVFPSTRNAIDAEKLCLKNIIPCQVIPVPRHISAECGIALEIDAHHRDVVESLFRIEKVKAEFYEDKDYSGKIKRVEKDRQE